MSTIPKGLTAIFEWENVSDRLPGGYGYFLVYGKSMLFPMVGYFMDWNSKTPTWYLAICGTRDMWGTDITKEVEWWAEIPMPPHEGSTRLQFSLWNR